MNHDNLPGQVSPDVNDSVWVSAIYVLDPGGIMLEFAAWQRPFSAEKGDRWDHAPARRWDIPKYRKIARQAASDAA